MNKKIGNLKFFNSFSEGDAHSSGSSSFKKNTLLAMALCASVALTGCANSGAIYNDVNSYNNVRMAEGEEVVKIKEFNFDTYDQVLKSKESGVYKNPYGNNSITSLKFISDKDGFKKIEKDLSDLGLDSNSIPFYVSNADGNRHEINPFGPKNDIGLNFLTDLEKSELLPAGYSIAYPELVKYESYFVVMHEIAHGFNSQHASALKSIFDVDHRIIMESISDYSATIKTMQLMHHDGLDDKEISKFIGDLASVRLVGPIFSDKTNSHYTGPLISSLVELHKQDPDRIYNMTGPQIEESSKFAVDEYLAHDFKNSIKAKFYEDEKKLEDIKHSVGKMKYFLNQEEPDIKGALHQFISDSKSEEDLQIRLEMSKYIASDYDLALNSSDNYQSVIDLAIKSKMGDLEVIKVNNLEGQKMISSQNLDNYSTLAMKISNSMDKAGANRTQNIAQIDIDSEYNLDNKYSSSY